MNKLTLEELGSDETVVRIATCQLYDKVSLGAGTGFDGDELKIIQEDNSLSNLLHLIRVNFVSRLSEPTVFNIRITVDP